MKIEAQNAEALERLGKKVADQLRPFQNMPSLTRFVPPTPPDFSDIPHQNARLEAILTAFSESSARADRRLVWLTVALVVLTAWLLALTAWLVAVAV